MQFCKSTLALVAWGLAGAVQSALAVPVNDNWANAVVVPAITTATPFTATEADVRSATTEPADPIIQCQVSFTKNPGQQYQSLWYSYTTGASVEYVNLSAAGSTYKSGTDISVYTGTPGAFHMISGGCAESGAAPGVLNGVRLQPNTTYTIEVASTSLLSASDATTDQLNFSASVAPIYTVGRSDDPIGASVPVCAAADPNPALDCSIRSALNASNLTPGAILIPAGTYAMTSTSTAEDLNADGDFDILVSMGIYGAGKGQTIVVAPLNDRAFDLPNTSFTTTTQRGAIILADMTLQGPGNAGIFTGDGALVRDNTVNGGYFFALQGLELSHGYTNSGLTQSNGGGAFKSIGRGHIRDSYIHDNTASNGGGVLLTSNSGYNLWEISNSLIAGNTATNPNPSSTSAPLGGGGILVAPGLRLQNSTVSGNTAVGFGGGVFVGRQSATEIRNSTITGNVAQAASGGGGLRRDHSTLLGGGPPPLIMVYNSIISGNTSNSAALAADDCNGVTPASRFVTARNVVGTLAAGSTCGFSTASPSNDQIGVDPQLGPLADNGGGTLTHALLPGSLAIDAGNTDAVNFPLGLCGNDFTGFTLTTPSAYTFAGVAMPYDQRGDGFARVLNGGSGIVRCDIGAFEVTTPGPAAGTPTLAATADSGTQGDNLTNVTTPSFTGTCTNGDTIRIAVNGAPDSAATTVCANAAYALTLGTALTPDGVFQITALTTRSGSTLPPSTALAITLDSTAPVISLAGPSGAVSSNSATFTFSANETVGSFSCTLDGNAITPCTSPAAFNGLAGGSHVFNVQAADAAANNGSATNTWTISVPAASAPVLAVASDSGVQGDNRTNVTTPSFSGTCSNGDTVQLAVNGAVDSGASGICASGAYVLTLGTALTPDGVFQITALTTQSGSTLPPSSALALTLDTTAPLISLAGPSGTVSSSSAAFTFSANEAVGGFSCTLDGNAIAACTSPVDFSGLTGSHTFAVQAIDAAGNNGNATNTWTIDSPSTQWSTDPANNLVIADRGGEQTQSKIAATTDGGFYISWFDNTHDGNNDNGYSVYLQRVDASGKELWPHDGILVAARSMGFTYDYGLAVDTAGNAVLSFNCCHNNDPDEHIVITKVSPTGTLLWNAPSGIRVTPAGSPKSYSAKVAATSDGNSVVTWSIQNAAGTSLEVHAQKFDANGNPQWSPEIVVATGGSNFVADIHGSDNGSVILSWGAQPNRGNNQLWAQKLSSTGQSLWGSSGIAIQGPGSLVLQMGSFPPFITDGAGGAVFSWFAVSVSSAVARVQHINAAGMPLLAANGLNVTTDTATNSHTDPSVSYDPASGDIYAVWRVADSSTQGHIGINAQRIDSAGQPQWGGGAGIVLVPQATNYDQSQVVALPAAGGGFIAEWVSGNVTFPNPINVTRLDVNGNYVWPGNVVQIKTAPTGTGKLSGALSSTGYAAYSWSDGSPSTIKVQNVMIDDGGLGFSDVIFKNGFE
jgi:hypothetical protein